MLPALLLPEDLDKDERSSASNEGDRLSAIRQYLREHPRTIIIDPLESVKIVISRAKTCAMLSHVCADVCDGVFQPMYVLIEDEHELTEAKILEKMEANGLKFPIICKPIRACGSPTSHHMAVVVDIKGLSLITFPCIIQQYHNHSSVFYKAYVIGNEVMVFQRPSLPDLSIREMSSLAFDSRLVYPGLKEFTKGSDNFGDVRTSTSSDATTPEIHSTKSEDSPPCFHDDGDRSNDDLNEDMDNARSEYQHEMYLTEFPSSLERLRNNFLRAAGAVSARFGLSLFGFDVIVPVEDRSKIFIIDVNFFPSYKEVSDFPSKLRRYFREKANVK